MNKTNAPRKPRLRPKPSAIIAALLLIPGVGVGGCGAPPSVVPVMRVVERTLLDEAARVEAIDANRDRLMLDAARQRLHDGYLADLHTTDTLDPAWVDSATSVYVAAREALLQQAFDLAQQRQTRLDNLQSAARAQARAIAILQRQDRLLKQTVGLDLWRLDSPSSEPAP